MPQADFEAVLAVGREKGQLTQGELVEALRTVELTPEVLTALIDRVTAEGVTLIVEEVVEVIEVEELTVEVKTRKEPRAAKSDGATDGNPSHDERQARRRPESRVAAPKTRCTPT